MDGAYLPQHVRQARHDGRLLGQVRDLLGGTQTIAGRERKYRSGPVYAGLPELQISKRDKR